MGRAGLRAPDSAPLVAHDHHGMWLRISTVGTTIDAVSLASLTLHALPVEMTRYVPVVDCSFSSGAGRRRAGTRTLASRRERARERDAVSSRVAFYAGRTSALLLATSRAPPVAYKCPAIASARWPPHGAGGGDGGVLESRRGRRVALRDLARGTSSPACPSVRAGVPDLPPLLGRRLLVSATERQELLHVPVVPPVGDPAVAVELRHTGDGDRQEPLTARVVGRALRGKLDAG
jgi:hypothetical protein